jgi:hypothetical protein
MSYVITTIRKANVTPSVAVNPTSDLIIPGYETWFLRAVWGRYLSGDRTCDGFFLVLPNDPTTTGIALTGSVLSMKIWSPAAALVLAAKDFACPIRLEPGTRFAAGFVGGATEGTWAFWLLVDVFETGKPRFEREAVFTGSRIINTAQGPKTIYQAIAYSPAGDNSNASGWTSNPPIPAK